MKILGINPRRVFAMVMRYWFYLRHSYDRLSDMFYWPLIDLLLWGITSQYLSSQGGNHNIGYMIISGLIFWIAVWRAQYEITVNFLSELWDKNLVNIFVSPLRFNEWLTAVYVVGISKLAVSFSFASLMAFILYRVNILHYGWYAPVFTVILMIMGWSVGMLVASVILRFGTKAQTLAWCAVMVVSPFSAIFYPLTTLPLWAQNIAKLVPASYVFENSRLLVSDGFVRWHELAIALALALFYFFIAFRLVSASFLKAKERGLIKVY